LPTGIINNHTIAFALQKPVRTPFFTEKLVYIDKQKTLNSLNIWCGKNELPVVPVGRCPDTNHLTKAGATIADFETFPAPTYDPIALASQ